MFQKFNKYFLNKKNDKLVKEISTKYLSSINDIGIQLKPLSSEEIIERFNNLKERNKSSKELSDIDLCEACAIIREVSDRAISLRHYDSQIIGGIALFLGFVTEMKTGEGKTLVATIPVILNFILGKKSHLVTVNDFLAKETRIGWDLFIVIWV